MQFEMERKVEVADVERVLDEHGIDGTIVRRENNTQIIIRTNPIPRK